MFQSTLPAWGSDDFLFQKSRNKTGFQSTLPAWGSDLPGLRVSHGYRRFQSTLPAWGSDGHFPTGGGQIPRFQSTLPAWGSDAIRRYARCVPARRFNPRSPRGGATTQGEYSSTIATVSIHAPRVGERLDGAVFHAVVIQFQSTLPAWGSDVSVGAGHPQYPKRVSIHAPRVGERRNA